MTAEIPKSRILGVREKVEQSLDSPWVDNGRIDPNANTVVKETGKITADAVSFAARKLPTPYNEHLVFDIETFSVQPQLIHFALIGSLEGDFSRPLRNVSEIISYVENLLYARCTSAEGHYRIALRAHNMQGFDAIAIASEIESTVEMPILKEVVLVDPVDVVENFKSNLQEAIRNTRDIALVTAIGEIVNSDLNIDELTAAVREIEDRCTDFFDRQKLANAIRKARVKRYASEEIAKGVSRDTTRSIIRKVEQVNPDTGRKVTALYQWSIRDYGARPILTCRLKAGTGFKSGQIDFLDTMWHATMPLDAIGESLGHPKGKTPLQYTDPFAWGEKRFNYDVRVERERFYQDWHDHLSPKAVEYCKQDLRILIEFLKIYREKISSLVPDNIGINIDPLNFMTAPQLGHAIQLSHMMFGAKSKSNFWIVYEYASQKIEEQKIDINGNEQVDEKVVKRATYKILKSEEELNWFLAKHDGNVKYMRVPLIEGNQPAVFENKTFFIYRKYQEAWEAVSFGGRTEIFSPMTPDGHYDFAIDNNSMYPGIFADPECKLINTNSIFPLNTHYKTDIVGRKAILEYLKKPVSGMYLIESAPPVNPDFRMYPVFPIRLNGKEYDSQLGFRGWDGLLLLKVTGEELRYFIENSEVEGDNIRIIVDESYHAPLLNFDPLSAFAQRGYKLRQQAKKEGDKALSFIIKMLMNSAGFGTLGQLNSQFIEFTENEIDKQRGCINRINKYSPNWSGWEGALSQKNPIDLIRNWAGDHYTNLIDFQNYNDDTVYRLPLPAMTAPHALKPWSSAITAYARVKLHKTMMLARKAGFELAYCDTDSVHISVPNELSKDQVIERLKNAGIDIDQDKLGAWKHEPAEAHEELLTKRCDVTDGIINKPKLIALAPKHYAYADQLGNCCAIVVKGVRKHFTAMKVGLKLYNYQHSSLGDRRGIQYDMTWTSDLESNVGQHSKREFVSAHESFPIIMRNPENFRGTWREYKAALADQFGENIGVLTALDTYKNLLFKGKSYYEIREKLDKDFEEISFEAASDEQYKDINSMIISANKL